MFIQRIKITGIVLLNSLAAFAQTPVGHTTITFNDPARTGGYGSGGGAGRQIQTEIYYPAASAANDVPVVGTDLPVIVFGHGFSMTWDAYQNIWEGLVNEGYIIAFPRTEGSLSPSHQNFGLDLAQVVSKVQALNSSSTSLFFGKIGTTSAIMGHSMGGGSSFLAGATNASVNTMVTLAAANTNPSSITSAQQISIPNLLISGVNDCVAPPADHQDKMYDSLISTYKTQINIIGGGHCYFANTNFNCSFGEGTCSPNPTISRGEQQDVTLDLVALWLRKFLKNDCNAAADFQDSLLVSTRITYRQNNPINCAGVGFSYYAGNSTLVYPNPAADVVTIKLTATNASLQVYDVLGKIIFSKPELVPNEKVDTKNWDQGVYLFVIRENGLVKQFRVIKD